MNLVIVENSKYLSAADQTDTEGRAVAIVDVRVVEPWRPDQVEAACSSGWQPGYLAWRLENVRQLATPVCALAARRLYELDLNL
jgi:hypothetical protein